MPVRVSGAVAPDVSAEALRLVTIKIRNQSYTNDPLAESFLLDIFSPAQKCVALALRNDWREMLVELYELMDSARSTHWESIPGLFRIAYDGRSGRAIAKSDYPAWAHRTATSLMYSADSVFQHGGEANSHVDDILHLARSLSGADHRVTDAQVFAGLAIKEAATAARHLVSAIVSVEQDDELAHWLRVVSSPEFRSDPMANEVFQGDIDNALDKAAALRFYPELPYITLCRVHAEKLLLLADVSAAGGLSAEAARKLAIETKSNRERREAAERALKANEVKWRAGVLKGAQAVRKLSETDKAEVVQEAARCRQVSPASQEKELEINLADRWGVSVSTIQRALGKKR